MILPHGKYNDSRKSFLLVLNALSKHPGHRSVGTCNCGAGQANFQTNDKVANIVIKL